MRKKTLAKLYTDSVKERDQLKAMLATRIKIMTKNVYAENGELPLWDASLEEIYYQAQYGAYRQDSSDEYREFMWYYGPIRIVVKP